MKLRDKIWIWGHPTNSLKGAFGLTKESDVSPIDGMRHMGVKKICYVTMGRACDKDEISSEMQENCVEFGWSKDPSDNIDDIIARKKKNPSYKILIYDDFFSEANVGNNAFSINKAELLENKKKLNENGIEMWMVYYESNLNVDISDYLDLFDGISFWFWNQPTEEEYLTTMEKFIEKTPNKKRLLGCYLYDFGRETACNADRVEAELEHGKEFVKNGILEGLILHTNAVGNMGFEAYERCAEWMKKNGDFEL